MKKESIERTTRIASHFMEATSVLEQFNCPENHQKLERAGMLMVDSLRAGGKIISCGNGGSMCDAMHFAEELTGRYRDNRRPIAALSISDPSHIACIANDFGYEYVFSRYVEAIGKKGDILLAFSTSGNSKNVLRAIEVARKQEIKIVGLTGKTGGEMASLCDVEIRAPYSDFADRAQEIHIKCVHALIDFIEENIG